MKQRYDTATAVPELYETVVSLDRQIAASGLDASLLHILKLRASQINGCSFCVDLHVKEALADGFDPQKLHLVSAWRESPFFDEAERAVLEWTESVSLLSRTQVPDETFCLMQAQFSNEEIAGFTVAIGLINLFNRIAVSSRLQHVKR
ncbi:carboxymuconolactone decarboxylase family protein [Croceicoccus bisphenolivorans]|uniref:carboxymuconolactone decarboxylase family protein n=1 Tax=Croceicoccus bisphenolivorans TaxID=1783232 RepID=UPI00082B8A36|nr:carboxymuconolactone decarboxylase family protein [Croceicoccus bisphenolivorans]